MDRKLFLAVGALMALSIVGCGDDDPGPTSGTGGDNTYYEAQCTAGGTECSAAGAAAGVSACCTVQGQCGAVVESATGTCDMGCGGFPCIAAPVGSGCCSPEGMCGILQGGSCVTSGSCDGVNACPSVANHPGCCLGDGASCGALYRGTCVASSQVSGLVSAAMSMSVGTGGDSGATTGDGGTAATVTCGTTPCSGFTLAGFTLAACCPPSAPDMCGYDASQLGEGCVTQAEGIALITSGGGGGDAGSTGTDAAVTGFGDASIGITDGGVTVGDAMIDPNNACAVIDTFADQVSPIPGAVTGCCQDNGTCGYALLGGACNDASGITMGQSFPCTFTAP